MADFDENGRLRHKRGTKEAQNAVVITGRGYFLEGFFFCFLAGFLKLQRSECV